MNRNRPRLFAIHCSAKGFGYVVFDGEAIYDWGTVVARGDKNAMSLRKLARLLDRFSPETLVMADAASERAERIVHLYDAVAALARARNIDPLLYRPDDIRRYFGRVGARTRQEIAECVVRQFDVLSPRLPQPRKPWQSEARQMAIFSAAAVALTHLSTGK